MADRDVKRLEKRRLVIEKDIRVLKAHDAGETTTATPAATTTPTAAATTAAATEVMKGAPVGVESQRLLAEMSQKIATGDREIETQQQVSASVCV